MRRAEEFVTSELIRESLTAKGFGTRLSQVQIRLRSRARAWPDRYTSALAQKKDYRSAVRKKRAEIIEYLTTTEVSQRQSWISAECFDFGVAVIDALVSELDVSPGDKEILKSVLLRDVVAIATKKPDMHAVREIGKECEQSIMRFRRAIEVAQNDPEIGPIVSVWPERLASAIDVRRTVDELLAPLVLASSPPMGGEQERRAVAAWALLRVYAAICRAHYGILSVWRCIPSDAVGRVDRGSIEYPLSVGVNTCRLRETICKGAVASTGGSRSYRRLYLQ
jgi:hypothetical protein